MQCLTPDKLTGVFKHVVGVCESIFVVELSCWSWSRIRDILGTRVRGGKVSQDSNQRFVMSMVVM